MTELKSRITEPVKQAKRAQRVKPAQPPKTGLQKLQATCKQKRFHWAASVLKLKFEYRFKAYELRSGYGNYEVYIGVFQCPECGVLEQQYRTRNGQWGPVIPHNP